LRWTLINTRLAVKIEVDLFQHWQVTLRWTVTLNAQHIFVNKHMDPVLKTQKVFNALRKIPIWIQFFRYQGKHSTH